VNSLDPNALGFLYSAVYNGMYMVLEIAITAVGALLIARIPSVVRKQTN
jgi:thiamine transporter ThiT